MNQRTLSIPVSNSTPTVRQAIAEQREADRENLSIMSWFLFFIVFAYLMGFWTRLLW